MSNRVEDSLRYTAEHEWARLEGDNILVVGITDHAQDALGDITWVELPKIGATFATGAMFGEVESVKTTAELYAPVAGEVVEVNSAIADDYDVFRNDPYGAAWIVKIRVSDPAVYESLLSADAYRALLG